MKTFLDEIAQKLLLNHNTDLRHICVVMPNRRAGLFLKKALTRIAGKSLWSPQIFSIEDFLINISGLNKTDQVALTFELFEIHRELEQENARDFEQFSKWGQVMLSDFNEIDMHMIGAKDMYSYLNEVKAIEKWNPDGRPLTSTEKEYLAFFNSIYKYYDRLQQRLRETKSGYQGMIYRHTAENIRAISQKLNWTKIYFAGFNALTKAEETVIDYLRENQHAEMVRDADAYYLDDKNQEAGEFLRQQLENEGTKKFGPISTFFKNSEKNIKVFGIPGKEGQAAKAGELLYKSHQNKSYRLEETAVILADEGLLIPVLNALPKDIQTFNITMGYPVRLTQPFTFIMLLLRTFDNVTRFGNLETEEHKGFYYRDILRILSHSLVTGYFDTRDFVTRLNKSKQVFYQPDDIIERAAKGQFQKFLTSIFSAPKPSPSQILDIITEVIQTFRHLMQSRIRENARDHEAKLQLEYLFHAAITFKRLRDLNTRYKSIITTRTLKDLFRQISSQTRLPFTGEPLKGLQIMGMLETRNLDFKRIILLSANEGNLPASAMGNSLIPYDIQVEMKMPTHNQKNAVFAYHFYRLLQRAEKIDIIYNTEPDKLGGGEQSRYVQQIMNELPAYNHKIYIKEHVETTPPPTKPADQSIEIPKTDEIFKSLMQYAAKGLSPTSLNQYRRCPLQFYLKNVAGINELEEVEENLEARTIGTIVHQVLEDMYKPFLKKHVSADAIRMMKQNTGNFIQAAFEKHYSKGQVKFGKNRLIYEVISNFIHAFLQFELDESANGNDALTIHGLEKPVISDNLSAHFPGLEDYEIRLRGFIDRMDQVGDTVRIIDYKTGKTEKADLLINSFEDFEDGEKKDKAFQVLLYAWLFVNTQPAKAQKLTTGIISLPKLTNKLMNFGVRISRSETDYNIDDDKLEEFEHYMLELMADIFNRDLPFSQVEDDKVCSYCNFREICNR